MEELVIKTDSKQIYGNVFKPENLQEKHPLMIFSHGYNGVGSDLLWMEPFLPSMVLFVTAMIFVVVQFDHEVLEKQQK